MCSTETLHLTMCIADRNQFFVFALFDLAVCVIVTDISILTHSTSQEFNDSVDKDQQPWVGFLNLEGDRAVFPWQFEVRNIDSLFNEKEIERVIIYLVINGEIHGPGLIVATWQKRVVNNALVDLPAGEYIATLTVANPETDDLLGLESEPTTLAVSRNTATDSYVQASALVSKVKAPGIISLVFYVTTAELDDVERIAREWRGGALSVAIYLNLIDQKDIDLVLSSVKAMHAKVEMLGRSALTISYLFATECLPIRESKCRGAFPMTKLINLAVSVVETDLLLLATAADFVSSSLVKASIDPAWLHRMRHIAMQGVALVVPLFWIAHGSSGMFYQTDEYQAEGQIMANLEDYNCTVADKLDLGTLKRLLAHVR